MPAPAADTRGFGAQFQQYADGLGFRGFIRSSRSALTHEGVGPQFQQYAERLASFRGRPPRAVPLLPADSDMPVKGSSEEEEEPVRAFAASGAKGTIGADPVSGSLDGVVVSILLPTKSRISRGPPTGDGTEPANFTTLDQIFVVVLKPHATYATYSCALPSAILV